MAPPPPATTGLRPLVPLGGGEGGEREGEGGGGGARVAPRTPAGASREGRGSNPYYNRCSEKYAHILRKLADDDIADCNLRLQPGVWWSTVGWPGICLPGLSAVSCHPPFL